MAQLKLENVYIHDGKYGYFGTVEKDGVWIPVRLVNANYPQRKGYNTVIGDQIWLDTREADKPVYRVKGNISVVKNDQGTIDELIKVYLSNNADE